MNTNFSDAWQKHEALVQTMRGVLIELGYPAKSIVAERVIQLDGQKFDADLLIFGSDDKSVLSVFEIKVGNNGVERAFEAGKRSLRGLAGRFPCFVVTKRDNGVVVADARENEAAWVSVSERDALLKLLGDYAINSNTRIAARQKKNQAVIVHDSLLYCALIGGTGVVFSFLSYVLEACGLPITRKPYFLIMGVLVLCSVFAGVSVHGKVDDKGAEISIGKIDKDARMARFRQELEE